MGFLAAIMGVGGGFIMVPAMIYILGMPTKVVIGTSLFQIIFVTAFTTVMHAVTSQTVDMMLALILILGGVIGAQIGARVGVRLKAEQLRILLSLLVLTVALRIAADLLLQPSELYSVTPGCCHDPAPSPCAGLSGRSCGGAGGRARGHRFGLSQNRVSITADFDGSEILVYGAVKREAPAPDGRLDVIITVEGPSTPLTVRRKDRVWGIWINNAAVEVDSAPSFYAVVTSGALTDVLSATENLRRSITIDRVVRAVGITAEADGSEAFVEAMMRVRSDEGRYRLLEGRWN